MLSTVDYMDPTGFPVSAWILITLYEDPYLLLLKSGYNCRWLSEYCMVAAFYKTLVTRPSAVAGISE